ncbi:MAG: type II toxin-antitoxin system VapC family toxin [Micrococcales bacterium]|nr:type II toxin-antitoxin system VapC family toxin [Micrococcales bacterium]
MSPQPPRRGLLDTSVVIDFPARQVAKAVDEVALSAVSVGELQYGVTLATDALTQLRRRQRVQAVLEQFDVLPFDVDTAEYYGALAALVRASGRNPRPRRMDLRIAATAVRHGLTLLTRNAKDFVGLESALIVIDLTDTR